MQTSDPDIYAVGDACSTCVFNVFHMHVITPKSRRDRVFSDQRTWVPLGGPANRQARIAVDHIFMGEKALAYPGSLGTAIVRVFDTYGHPPVWSCVVVVPSATWTVAWVDGIITHI